MPKHVQHQSETALCINEQRFVCVASCLRPDSRDSRGQCLGALMVAHALVDGPKDMYIIVGSDILVVQQSKPAVLSHYLTKLFFGL